MPFTKIPSEGLAVPLIEPAPFHCDGDFPIREGGHILRGSQIIVIDVLPQVT